MARKSPDPRNVLRGHRKGVKCVCFYRGEGAGAGSEDDVLLFSGDQEGRLKAWDLRRRRASLDRRLYPQDSGFVSLCAVEGEGKLLTQGREGCVKYWDAERLCSSLEGERPLAEFSTGCYNFCRFSASSSADGGDPIAALPSSDASVVEIWDVGLSKRISVLQAPTKEKAVGMCTAVCLKAPAGSGDGTLVWAGYESGDLACFDLRQSAAPLALASFSSNEPLMSIAVDKTGLAGVAASVGSELVQFEASPKSGEGGEPGRLGIRALETFEMKQPGVSEVSIRSDGRIFVAAGWDGRVRVFDYKKRAPLAVLKYHQKNCNAVAFSPGCGLLASASEDSNIALWDIYPTKKKTQAS
ncbi:WD40 repeat domain-containing protein [Chloropicon primus]|nr:WD40 repeat domain-containing protein [Chloropicon primus]